jgi:dihydroneopterin aldolase
VASGDRPVEIQIRGLVVEGVHGVLESERVRTQPFEVDIDVTADVSASRASDRLEDTVDYAAVVERVARVIAGDHSYSLLEALADACARAVLDEDDRIETVVLTVRKLDPPIRREIGSTGVRVVVHRGE